MGQLGLGDIFFRFYNSLDNNLTIFNNRGIKQVAVLTHTLVLLNDNTVFAFGDNTVNIN